MSVRNFTLGRGLRCVLLPNASRSEVGIAIALAGTRFETPSKNGISHAVEHHIAGETPSYPTFELFAKRVDSITSAFDQNTGKGAITFSAECLRRHVNECLDFLAEMLRVQDIRVSIYRRERERILEELRNREDDPDIQAEELVEKLLFSGHQLGHQPAGLARIIRSITINDLRRWHRGLVRGPVVMVVTGNFDPARVETHIRKTFVGIPGGSLRLRPFRSRQRRPRLLLVPKSQRTVRVAIAFPTTFGLGHPNRIVLSALNNHFGGTNRWSSRLVISLMGDTGLVHRSSSSVWNYHETGQFVITASVGPKNLIRCLRVLRDELRRLREQPLDDEELRLTMRSLKRHARDRSFDPAREASLFAEMLMVSGQLVTAEQYVRELNQLVTPTTIQTLARRMIRMHKLNMILIGPVRGLQRSQLLDAIRF